MRDPAEKPVTAVIVGGGHRSVTYADYSLAAPAALKIVGVADPNPERREMCRKRYGIPAENCFNDTTELASRGRIADAVINGTMDHLHYETSVPMLKLGYDMLLEKPFAVSKEEMDALLRVIAANGNRVMVCHVLRYAPFYRSVKEKLLSGALGDIINIQMAEHVSYHHLSTSYVRGKWANSDICKTSMLLAKSCHDVDLMMWLMQLTLPMAVSSEGGLFQFKPENAPANAGTRCTIDCPLVDSCRYSAKNLYLMHPTRWECYAWADIEHKENITDQDRIDSFNNGNPYNRCIYKCGNNVVDHQSVLIGFASGATGTFNMVGGTAKSMRKLHITGTLGELYGVLDDNKYTISRISALAESGFEDEVIDLSGENTRGHGGGDEALIADFVTYLRTGKQSVSCTAIENSIAGHLTVFLADKSREEGGQLQKIDFSPYADLH
ncbi:MAG: Gfo/Idh/MocA family oxidoreductase [Clostridia bacterium]|nr:Gfo/Idh/MocA family oxidoreductase [Clostridia bacterium]